MVFWGPNKGIYNQIGANNNLTLISISILVNFSYKLGQIMGTSYGLDE